MQIIVTGGIACGKSTVTALLKKHLPEYAVVSIDDLVRDLYACNDRFQRYLQETFGTADREAVSRQVFANPDQRQVLEHRASQELQTGIAEVYKTANLILEFPLYFERGVGKYPADFVIAVCCPMDAQLRRIEVRDGKTGEEAKRILSAQLSVDTKRLLADATIDTEQSPNDVERQVINLVRELRLKTRVDALFGTPAVWPVIRAAYSEAHRRYHTLQHLDEMFEHLAPWLAGPHGVATALAVLGHDLVYFADLVRYVSNETASVTALAQLVRQHCSAAWQAQHAADLVLASELILATRKHALSPYLEANAELRPVAARFLDADLAILASPPERLDEYDFAIAKEWEAAQPPSLERSLFDRRIGSPVPVDAQYAEARAAALRALQVKRPLFISAEFAHLNPVAETNLAMLIERYAPPSLRRWLPR